MVCSICLGEEKEAVVLGCDHSFCSGCIIPWFRSSHSSHGSCPVCRDNPCDEELVYAGNRTMLGASIAAARRKEAPDTSKRAYSEYRKAVKERIASNANLSSFLSENKEFVRKYKALKQKRRKSYSKVRKTQRVLCRMHPVVPVLTRAERL